MKGLLIEHFQVWGSDFKNRYSFPISPIGIVFDFSWDISQEKLQTTVMQIFWGEGVVIEVYYGIVQVVNVQNECCVSIKHLH